MVNYVVNIYSSVACSKPSIDCEFYQVWYMPLTMMLSSRPTLSRTAFTSTFNGFSSW